MMRIDAAVSQADAEALAAVGAEMGGFTLGDCPEILLIWYAGATPRLREVVLKYGPPEISSGKVNALDVLLQGGIQTRGNTKFETLPLPIATSFLPDQKNPTRYAPKSAVDGDPATSWVEGAEGPGVGQKIAVAVPEGAAVITVLPGFGDSRYWSRNNRLRSARLRLYALADILEAATVRWGHTYMVRGLEEAVLSFSDEMRPQNSPLPKAPMKLKSNERLLVVLEILQVYPGSQWDDTCISEIHFLDAAGRPLRTP